MKMYKTSKNNLEIQEIEVIRQTDSCIWVNDWRGNPRKELKFTNYNDHFETWEHAKNHIVNREKRKLEWAKDSLKNAEITYQKALELSLSGSEV